MEQGLSALANPRNAASGSLRMKDPREVAKRNLEAFLYNVSYYTTNGRQPTADLLSTHAASLQMLWECGVRSP